MTDPSSRFRLHGKVALVTGGSKGLGRFMALELARAGAVAVIVCRHPAEGQEVVREIRREGGEALVLYADLARIATLSPMVKEAVRAFGKIDILVNNAGVNIRRPALEFEEHEWDQILDTNLKGVFFCSQAVARVMIDHGGGKIINISSAAGNAPVPRLTPYSVSKAGVVHLTRALALEWTRYGITVNAVAPSYVDTPLTRDWLADPRRYELIAKRSPMKRLAQPQDLAGALLLFASDESGFINGQTLLIDGGGSAGWAVEWD
jgi:NAD(P)-dependent dehydrogenase (short-subunit alcohol dehydrogenase family)